MRDSFAVKFGQFLQRSINLNVTLDNLLKEFIIVLRRPNEAKQFVINRNGDWFLGQFSIYLVMEAKHMLIVLVNVSYRIF